MPTPSDRIRDLYEKLYALQLDLREFVPADLGLSREEGDELWQALHTASDALRVATLVMHNREPR